jgi:hypothetical protein
MLIPKHSRWSWASIDGEISYRGFADESAVCVEACVIPAGSDPTGPVSAGFLLLSGPTVIVRIREAQEGFWHYTKYVLETGGKEFDFVHDCDDDFKDGSLAVGETLLGLKLGPQSCMVLKQIGIDSTNEDLLVYRRIGYSPGFHNDYSGPRRSYWVLPYGPERISVKII